MLESTRTSEMDEFGVLKACQGQFRPMKKSVAENGDSTRRLEEQSRETVWFSFQFFQFDFYTFY